MHALRPHKRTIPGYDKSKEIRRLQQLRRQRAARSSLFQGLRTFLTADSFMYGPLMESPPLLVYRSDDSDPHTPEREHENGGLDDGSTRDDTNRKESDTNCDKNENGHDESATRYQGSISAGNADRSWTPPSTIRTKPLPLRLGTSATP